MISLLIRTSIALLVLNQVLTPCTAYRGRGYNSAKYGNQGYKEPSKLLPATSSGLPSQNNTRRGLGISAWGIVVLVVSLVLAGMGFYYFSICYPVMCLSSTRNKYDKMSMPTLV